MVTSKYEVNRHSDIQLVISSFIELLPTQFSSLIFVSQMRLFLIDHMQELLPENRSPFVEVVAS